MLPELLLKIRILLVFNGTVVLTYAEIFLKHHQCSPGKYYRLLLGGNKYLGNLLARHRRQVLALPFRHIYFSSLLHGYPGR